MAEQVTILSVTANTPVDIYYCDSLSGNCVFVATVLTFPYTFTVPSPYSEENFVIRIDDSQFCEVGQVILVTPTQTPTPTLTPGLSPTPTSSITPTKSSTPNITNTPTNTKTPTQTKTPSVTPTQTKTPTKTPLSPTPTRTQTSTPTVTRTPTKTATLTPSPTKTEFCLSPSVSQTPTPTPNVSPSGTPTPTSTPNTSPSGTPTETPTETPTQTQTQTPSSTIGSSPTQTPTNTETPTNTPSNTPTETQTNTPTESPTNTPSNTPTETQTNTPTESPTGTPTETPTQTQTPTPSSTIGSSPTQTPTNTETPTQTQTPTNTETPTQTQTPTSTPDTSPTSTPTQTPTSTDTCPGPQVYVISTDGNPGDSGCGTYVDSEGGTQSWCVDNSTSPLSVCSLSLPVQTSGIGINISDCQGPCVTPTSTATPSVTPTQTPQVSLSSTPTPTPTPTNVAVDNYDILYIDNDNDVVGVYDPVSNTVSSLLSPTSPEDYQDIGLTSNKMYLSALGGTGIKIYKYNITLNPWTASSPTSNTFVGITQAAGMCAIDDNVVALAGQSVWTGNTTTSSYTLLFNLPANCTTTGDIIYNPTNNQYVISYTEEGDDNYYFVAIFDSSGNIVSGGTPLVEYKINMGSISTIFGLYTYNNNVYAVSGDFDIYQLNFATSSYGSPTQPSNIGTVTQVGLTNITSQVNWII